MATKAPEIGSFCTWVQSVAPSFSTCSGKIEQEGDYYCSYHQSIWERMLEDDDC
jgi:hypothetical protein